VALHEGPLDRTEITFRRTTTLHSGHRLTVHSDREEKTGADRLAVEQDRTRAADTMFAADVGAGLAEIVAQVVGQ
jgi:hypothetical protein